MGLVPTREELAYERGRSEAFDYARAAAAASRLRKENETQEAYDRGKQDGRAEAGLTTDEVRALLAELRAWARPPETQGGGQTSRTSQMVYAHLATRPDQTTPEPRPGQVVSLQGGGAGIVLSGAVPAPAAAAGQTVTLPADYSVEWPDRSPGLAETIGRPLERLLWLLGLSAEERSFCQALAAKPDDRPLLLVFADWLEEQGRPAEALAMRRLVPGDGDVLVLTYQPRGSLEDMRRRQDSLWAAGQKMREDLKTVGREVYVTVLPEGYDLAHLDPKALKAAGWTREPEPEEKAAEMPCGHPRSCLAPIDRELAYHCVACSAAAREREACARLNEEYGYRSAANAIRARET